MPSNSPSTEQVDLQEQDLGPELCSEEGWKPEICGSQAVGSGERSPGSPKVRQSVSQPQGHAPVSQRLRTGTSKRSQTPSLSSRL